jgi:hypothetical protein
VSPEHHEGAGSVVGVTDNAPTVTPGTEAVTWEDLTNQLRALEGLPPMTPEEAAELRHLEAMRPAIARGEACGLCFRPLEMDDPIVMIKAAKPYTNSGRYGVERGCVECWHKRAARELEQVHRYREWGGRGWGGRGWTQLNEDDLEEHARNMALHRGFASPLEGRETTPCRGCGRPVIRWQWAARYWWKDAPEVAAVCSERCRRWAYYGHSEPHRYTCEVCGETTTSSRNDSRYCSNACRQRAYRQRKRAS